MTETAELFDANIDFEEDKERGVKINKARRQGGGRGREAVQHRDSAERQGSGRETREVPQQRA